MHVPAKCVRQQINRYHHVDLLLLTSILPATPPQITLPDMESVKSSQLSMFLRDLSNASLEISFALLRILQRDRIVVEYL